MAYDDSEQSREEGSPIELYDITLGSSAWHFTSGEESVDMDDITYDPLPVQRDAVPVGAEDRKNEIGITLPADHEFVQKYTNVVPGDRAFITIRRFHRYDDDTGVISLFKGTVTAVKFENNTASASIGVAPFTDKLSLPIPRYVYSGLCNNVLGDQWCTVNLETGSSPDGFAFKYSGSVEDVITNRVRVNGLNTAGYPDNFFQAGKIVTAAGDQRLVVRSTSNNLTIYVPMFEGDALVGNSVDVFAGCDHSLVTCKAKFDNVINYGGFPYVPRTNPFSTGIGG